MNWITTLATTYENCHDRIGDSSEAHPLMPLSHTTQNIQIQVTLDQNANFLRATIVDKKQQATLIPATEKSAGRAGAKPTTHPLADKLQYLAGDFLDYGGDVTSGYKNDPQQPHHDYLEILQDWQKKHPHPKVQIILLYIKKNRLVKDLAAQKIIPLTDDSPSQFIDEWEDKETQPAIFGALPNKGKPQDALVRWRVEIPDDRTPETWLDRDLWESWHQYYLSTQPGKGLCYATGDQVTLALQSPSKLRHAGDKAKLISANDGSGFTYRGRFTDKDGDQACAISFDITQKAHNALRWLIARQGQRFDTLAVVAWATSGNPTPPIAQATDQLLTKGASNNLSDDQSEEDDLDSQLAQLLDRPQPNPDAPRPSYTAQEFATALNKKLSGFAAKLEDKDNINLIALDSATTGRMSITYFRQFDHQDYLERLAKWHTQTAWPQNFGKNRKFIGAPSPTDIARCAYGSRLDHKLKAATNQRLIPCIIESQPIPLDLVRSCLHRAITRQGQEHWEWEKNLGIACALYRKHHIQTNQHQHQHSMSLERNRNTRSYLYGRLLAVAEKLEEATYNKGEHRATNAERHMQIFADKPFTTWAVIEKALIPYKRTLRANQAPIYHYYDNEIQEIMTQFKPDDYAKDQRLDGEFLLAYHCERSWLSLSKEKKQALAEATA